MRLRLRCPASSTSSGFFLIVACLTGEDEDDLEDLSTELPPRLLVSVHEGCSRLEASASEVLADFEDVEASARAFALGPSSVDVGLDLFIVTTCTGADVSRFEASRGFSLRSSSLLRGVLRSFVSTPGSAFLALEAAMLLSEAVTEPRVAEVVA